MMDAFPNADGCRVIRRSSIRLIPVPAIDLPHGICKIARDVSKLPVTRHHRQFAIDLGTRQPRNLKAFA